MFGTHFAIIGIEEQSEIHYAMPVRTMGYDFLGYDTQLKKIIKRHRLQNDLQGKRAFLSGILPDDKLEPVITIVLYYGTEPWTGPRCLHDILALQNFPEALRKYVNNYQLHLIEVNRFEHLEYFQTDLKLVFGFFQNHTSREKLKRFIKENESELSSIEEYTYDLLASMTHSKELTRLKANYQTGGKMDMCKGLRDWMEEERKAGEVLGEARGEARFASLTKKLLKANRTDDLLKATTDEKYRNTLDQKYRL